MVLNKILLILFPMIATAAEQTLPHGILAQLKPLNTQASPSAGSSQKDKILYFWATWCPDCKDKLTSVFKDEDLYKKFDVYLIATDKDLEKVKHFQAKHSIHPQVFTDEERALQKNLGVFSVPTIVRLTHNQKNLVVSNKQSGGDIEPLLKENPK